MRLVLESASLSDASLEGSPTAQTRAAGEHMAAYLAAAWQPVAAAWKSRHKHQLRASALILQAWLHAPPPALARLQGDKTRYGISRAGAGSGLARVGLFKLQEPLCRSSLPIQGAASGHFTVWLEACS